MVFRTYTIEIYFRNDKDCENDPILPLIDTMEREMGITIERCSPTPDGKFQVLRATAKRRAENPLSQEDFGPYRGLVLAVGVCED